MRKMLAVSFILAVMLHALGIMGCEGKKSVVGVYPEGCELLDNNNVDVYRDSEGRIVRFRALFTSLNDLEKQCMYRMKNLIHLQAEECGISGNDLKGLQFLKIESLDLDGNDIGDDGMKFIARMNHLQRLSLQHTGISGVGLKELSKNRNIEVLLISWNDIDDADLICLQNMKGLHFLGVRNTRVTENGVAFLRNKNKNLIIDH
jgi:hypothetical protein